VGLSPGEKLFEQINCKREHYRPTQHPRIMSFVTAPDNWALVRSALDRLVEELHHAEPDRLKKLLQQSVPEYFPFLASDNIDVIGSLVQSRVPVTIVPKTKLVPSDVHISTAV